MTDDEPLVPDEFERRHHWPLVWALIEHDGRNWTPIPRPKGIRKRRDKACFVNCATHPRIYDHTYVYCEGLALFEINERVSMWVHHAWLGDAEGNAIDVTWSEPGIAYFGRAFDPMEVARAVGESHRFGGMTDA